MKKFLRLKIYPKIAAALLWLRKNWLILLWSGLVGLVTGGFSAAIGKLAERLLWK